MKERKKISFALLLSLFLHIGILVFLTVKNSPLFQQQKVAKKEPMQVEWVELQEPPPKPVDESIQIVQQDDKSINNTVPEKDYKLSATNQNVLQETKAAKHGAFQNKKNQQEGDKVAKPTEPTEKTPPQEKPHPVKERQKAFANLQPKLFDDQYAESKLRPPSEPAISGADVSQSDDYLKDVVAGAETLLKTREFVYYAYYNRIKGKLRQHWEPRIKEKIVKILRQGRKIASTNDKITRLVITLDQTGELVRIQVKGASGYNDLDDAAIEAFRAAAPFPNPPDGIVDGSGKVEINWDFVLET